MMPVERKATIRKTLYQALAALFLPASMLAMSGTNLQAGELPSVTSIDIDAADTVGPMYPMWAYFGYDEPNYTYMPGGRKLLTEISELSPVPVYVRAHNMLNTDEGPPAALKWGSTNVYTEDEAETPYTTGRSSTGSWTRT